MGVLPILTAVLGLRARHGQVSPRRAQDRMVTGDVL